MIKAFTDIRSFITVVTISLLAYCVIWQVPIPEFLKEIVTVVVSFFLGVQSEKLGRGKTKTTENEGSSDNNEQSVQK